MHELKEKYIQFCCDFYNEHAPEDKIWFGRMFEQCQEDYEQQNRCMYRWQFPLKVLKDQQALIDSLKTQLNNMEQCYIQVKKERDDAVYLKNEHRKRRCQLAKELTQKSLRLTDVEFEYKRIKGLQAKDCLQIMRLTARNEKLSDELKALRGESCQ